MLPAGSSYAGASACAECHAVEFERQTGSHHAQALRPLAGSALAAYLLAGKLPGVSYALGGKKASMALFAERLSEQLRRPVFDRTGIQGEFDFKVDYAIDDNPETGPSIFNAIQEELGLKLETTKGPIETLIIEHAEKPGGN